MRSRLFGLGDLVIVVDDSEANALEIGDGDSVDRPLTIPRGTLAAVTGVRTGAVTHAVILAGAYRRVTMFRMLDPESFARVDLDDLQREVAEYQSARRNGESGEPSAALIRAILRERPEWKRHAPRELWPARRRFE